MKLIEVENPFGGKTWINPERIQKVEQELDCLYVHLIDDPVQYELYNMTIEQLQACIDGVSVQEKSDIERS